MEWFLLVLAFFWFVVGLAHIENNNPIPTAVCAVLAVVFSILFIVLRLNSPVGEGIEQNISYITSTTESKVNVIYYKDGAAKVITKELDDPLGILLANSYSNVFLVEEVVELRSGNFRTNSPTFKVKSLK